MIKLKAIISLKSQQSQQLFGPASVVCSNFYNGNGLLCGSSSSQAIQPNQQYHHNHAGSLCCTLFPSRISTFKSHSISSFSRRYNMTSSGNNAATTTTTTDQNTQQLNTRSVQTLAKPAPYSFKASDVVIRTLKTKEQASKPAWDKLVFGHHCTDHMIRIKWNKASGWEKPEICPVENLSLHPYSKVFHYSLELFEGMKAYRGPDNKVRLFRPDLNMARMRNSAERLCLPDFDSEELIILLKKYLQIDQDWVPPYEFKSSLYIRPTLIGTEPALGVSPSNEAILFVAAGPVGPYFPSGFKPISLFADSRYIRAWPGGTGDRKIGSNYGPTLTVQQKAVSSGHQQVLWLYGPDHQLTEIGTMNIFVVFKRSDGKIELCTPPLNSGLILPGITRASLLEIARSWNEFEVVERVITMDEIQTLDAENRLLEIFGAGTACVVCPVSDINYEGKLIKLPELNLSLRLNKALTDIQYGVTNHEWSVLID